MTQEQKIFSLEIESDEKPLISFSEITQEELLEELEAVLPSKKEALNIINKLSKTSYIDIWNSQANIGLVIEEIKAG